MDLSLSPDQMALQDAVARLYTKESQAERVRSAEETGFDSGLWRALAQMGLPTMGVPEDLGGGDATLTDLAVVTEQHGAFLGSAPLVETVVVARLLARSAERPVQTSHPGAAHTLDRSASSQEVGSSAGSANAAPPAEDGRSAVVGLLDRLVAGAPAGFAVRPAVEHTARLVPGGSVAAVVVALDGDELVAVTPEAPPSRRPTTHAGPVADVGLRPAVSGDPDAGLTTADTKGHTEGGDTGRIVVAVGEEARAAYGVALDEWRVLTAVGLAGLARSAQDLGVQYAKERHQFGVPIGSFQAIQHRLADLHTATDGARLLAYEAAWAVDVADPAAAALAAQAFWFCGQTAEDAAQASLHVHGGYGFMLEYDIQLYARRAKGWRLTAGDPHHELRTIARRRWLEPRSVVEGERPQGGRRSSKTRDDRAATATRSPAPCQGMDFQLDADTLAFRDEVRAFLAEHLTADVIERALATGTMHDWALHRKLCERGYLAAGWPTEVGGLGRSAVATTALMQELYRAGAPVDGMAIAALVGATLLLRGNESHTREVLPRILAGQVICCLGYSEPEAGSDVAAVRTRAVRDGTEWVINGQKMFTTMAHEAEYVFLLTRTNLDVPKHHGLTMFLVPMATPGIEITSVETLGGERTNITFYTDVRVPDACRVGDVDAGWSVMHAALVYERNSSNWGEPAHLVAAVAEWAATPAQDGTRPLDDPGTQERLARWDTLVEVGRLLLYRAAWMAASGALPHVEGSMAQLWLPETFVGAANDLMDLCGPEALTGPDSGTMVLGGLVEHAFRHAMVTTIYGGSSEVQREIIAQRGLGLPRGR